MPIELNIKELSQDSRLGRMLAAGRLTATLKSKKSEEHITLAFSAKVKLGDHNWETAPFAEATHVFINLGRYNKVGTYYPQTGKLYLNREYQTAAYEYTVKQILLAAKSGITEDERHSIQEEERCGRCGRQLTDPVSIERGIGPECYGQMTGSVHHKQHKGANDPNNTPPEAPSVLSPNPAPVSTEITGEQYGAFSTPVEDKKGRVIPRTFADLAASVKK